MLPEASAGWELGDWEPGTFATFEVGTLPGQELAASVDSLFRTLYDCPLDYELDVEIYVVQDDEIPEVAPIRREEGYHTDQIGSFRDGQFMGFVVATVPSPVPDDRQEHERWYAVLHQFDAEGNHVKTDHWFTGTSADGRRQVVQDAGQRLSEMLDELEDKDFGDVQIRLFSTQIDDTEFGLVDATFEDEETGEIFVRVELLPNGLVFYDPWDGAYDT